MLGIVIFAVVLLARPRFPLSEEIQKQLTFSLLYPDGSSGHKIAADTATYDGRTKVLIFHAKKGEIDMTISEQATPEQFNDIPEYYPKLVEKLHAYTTFDSLHGKVSLTQPEELKGEQSAVFNGKGTLMFVHPSRNLSVDEWRDFFNTLAIAE